jgi:hypothetical protein
VLDATEWVAVSHMNASIKARKEFACVSSLLWPLRKGAVCGGHDCLFDPIPFSVSTTLPTSPSLEWPTIFDSPCFLPSVCPLPLSVGVLGTLYVG